MLLLFKNNFILLYMFGMGYDFNKKVIRFK